MHNILVGTSAQLVLILFTLPLMVPASQKQATSELHMVPGYIKATQCKKKMKETRYKKHSL